MSITNLGPLSRVILVSGCWVYLDIMSYQMLRNGAWDQYMSALEPPVKEKLSKYQV
ncbi:conserved hypothetical protein [Ricinus communis]|uniref:Uncharacterized protein n=1 Tax=Ricinus communis TaxID=3988 RepID=B9S5I9_RICCO|nr:conserved hypothetical protein [Ricinus communis]